MLITPIPRMGWKTFAGSTEFAQARVLTVFGCGVNATAANDR